MPFLSAQQPQFGAIKRATLPLSYKMVTPSAAIVANQLNTGTVMADVWELEPKDRGRFSQLLHYWAKDPVTSKVTTLSRMFTQVIRLLDNPFFRMLQQATRDVLLGIHAFIVGKEGLAIPGVQLQRQWIKDTFDPNSHKTFVMTLGQRTLGYVQTQKMGNTMWVMALENAFWHRRGPNGLPIRLNHVYEGLMYTALQQQKTTYLAWIPLNDRVGELHAQRYKRWFGTDDGSIETAVPRALQAMTTQMRELASTATTRHQDFVSNLVSQVKEPRMISQADETRFMAPVLLPEPHDALPGSTGHPVLQTAAH